MTRSPGLRGPQPRIVGAERQALIDDVTRLYALGMSMRAIATQVGHSYGLVHDLLHQSDTTVRTRSGPRTTPRKDQR